MINIITNDNGVFFMNGENTIAVLTDDGRFYAKRDVGFQNSLPTPSMSKEEIKQRIYPIPEMEIEWMETPSKPWYKFW